MEVFPVNEVQHMVRRGLDHAPLHVIRNALREPVIKPFKFLNIWTKHNHFRSILKDNERNDFVGNPFTEFQAKLKRVEGALA